MTAQIKEDNKKVRWIALIAVLVFTAILYSGSVKNSILYGWDDGEYIENADIRQFDVSKFFSTYYLGMYQPLAVLTISANYQAAHDNPVPYHTTNLLIHLINVILVFYLFYSLAGRIDIATFISLLFAIHPMNVEAVEWIAARSTGLYSMFYLAALLSYLAFLKKKSILYLVLTFVFFLLSCLTKSMAMTLPLVLFTFDYYLGRKWKGRVVWEKVPFFIVSVVIGIVTINAASSFGHIRNLDVSYNLFDRLLMLIYSLVFYLVKAVGPANLSAVYAYPDKSGFFLPWEYYLALLIFGVIILNIVILGKSRKRVLFGLMFFAVTIAPVLPLVWSRMLMLADRYTYIPYLGIFFILARIYIRFIESNREQIQKYKLFINTGLFIYILFLSITSYQRTKVWKDAQTLMTDVIEKDRSDVDVSIGYFFRGNINDRSNDMNAALTDFSEAIKLNPKYTLAYNNRGIIRGSMQNFKGAMEDFNKAIELEPNYADAFYNRGNVNYYLKHFDDACSDWDKAANLGSDQAAAIKNKYCNSQLSR